jgi:hypothetical protein
MYLEDGCEWAEDPRLWLCCGCMTTLAEKSMNERDAALFALRVLVPSETSFNTSPAALRIARSILFPQNATHEPQALT